MLYCVMQWSIFTFMYFVFLSFALFHVWGTERNVYESVG